ncbi:MAG: serine hydrolase [Cyclobacteriaceae bacterium]|nr:serine hydrolase [Cyclobacteriaceae bacterium]
MMKSLLSLGLVIGLFLTASCQPNLNKLDAYIEKARLDWNVPGMSVAIVKDGKIVLSKGYGVKEQGKTEAVDANTLFAIASNTKAFVSSSLATLVASGQMHWDDKVVDYLPYFQLQDPYATREATIRDLLCHRLGLGTFSGDVSWYKSDLPASEVIKRAYHLQPTYSFRSGYGYSNLMFIAAGEVIRATTGKPWDAYVDSVFFTPLGMERTCTSVSSLGLLGNVATPHKSVGSSNQPIDWTRWDNMGAAGGIISSSQDMAQWLLFNLNRGTWEGKSILSAVEQNILWTPHNSFVVSQDVHQRIPGRHFNAYGLGWGLSDYYGRMLVSHSGGYDGMYSRVALVPDENLGIVILTNSMTGIGFPLMMYIINSYIHGDDRDWSADFLAQKSEKIEDLVKERQASRKMGTSPTLELEKYCGNYFDPIHGKIFIQQKDDNLRLVFENAPGLSATLRHWHADTWEIKWDQVHAWFDFGTIRFELDNNLAVTGIRFDVPNFDIFFDELKPGKID